MGTFLRTPLVVLLTLCCFFQWVSAVKVGFIKPQDMDQKFPGPVERQDKSLPVGHMRPLGWQRETDGPVREGKEMPNTREFFEDYIKKNMPVVFRKGVKDAPSFKTWDDDNYLKEKYGNENVTVRVFKGRYRDKVRYESQVMKFSAFLFDYHYDELYLASYIPKGLMPELPLPKCIRCGTVAEKLLSSHLWMSSGGTSSTVHSHDDHLLHCVLFGRRDFILINSAHKKHFDYHENFHKSMGGHSTMDPNNVNVYRFRGIPKVPWRWSTLKSGDCIFVPAGYLHQVRSYGRSVSVTLEFAPLDSFDDTGCSLVEDEFIPLNDAIYYLTFEDGEVRLTDTNMGAQEVRNLLLVLMGRSDTLTQDKFIHFYQKVLGKKVEGVTPPKNVFKHLVSKKGDKQVTRRDVNSMTAKKLINVAKAFNEGYKANLKAREALAELKKFSRSIYKYKTSRDDL